MYTFNVKASEIKKLLPPGFDRQVPFIISKTINDTLFAARKQQVGDSGNNNGGMIDQYIKGGARRFTKRGMMVTKSRKNRLSGKVAFEGKRSYMRSVVFGETERPKPGKRTLTAPSAKMLQGNLPGNKLNKYGGIPYRTVPNKAAKKSYFVGTPHGARSAPGRSPYGLWQRYGRRGDQNIRLIIDMSKRRREAEITYPADQLLRSYVLENVQQYAKAAAEFALKTAR